MFKPDCWDPQPLCFWRIARRVAPKVSTGFCAQRAQRATPAAQARCRGDFKAPRARRQRPCITSYTKRTGSESTQAQRPCKSARRFAQAFLCAGHARGAVDPRESDGKIRPFGKQARSKNMGCREPFGKRNGEKRKTIKEPKENNRGSNAHEPNMPRRRKPKSKGQERRVGLINGKAS